MFNLLKSEVYKLLRSTAFRVLLFLNTIFSTFASVMFVQSSKSNPDFIITGKDALASGFSDTLLLFVFCGILSGLFVASEFSSGGIRNMITYGHSRLKVFSAKLIIYSLGSLLLTTIYPTILTLTSTSAHGWGVSFSTSETLTAFRIILLALLLNLTLILLCGVISFLVKENGLSIGICIGGGLMLHVILQLITSFLPQFSWLYDYSPLGLYAKALDSAASITDILTVIGISILTILFVYCIGLFRFTREDLK